MQGVFAQFNQGSTHALVTTPALEDARLWAAFGGAETAQEFCRSWLTIQCRSIPAAQAALLLIEEHNGHYATAAVWPDQGRDLTYLAEAAEKALKQRQGLVHAVPGRDDAMVKAANHIAYPIEVGGHLQGVVVVDVGPREPAELPRLMRQLHWGIGWLETLFRRRQAEETTALATRTSFALDILAGASEHRPFQAAAMNVVNDLAARLACRRVSLGLVEKNAIRLAAISHSANFQEKTQTIATIENAMEEVLDQGATISVPEVEGTQRRIALAHKDLAKLSGAQSVLSVMLTSVGRSVGVLTLERDQGEIFDEQSVQLLEAVAVLLGPSFELKVQADRLITGKLVDGTGSFFKALFGRRHPAMKLAALLVVAAVAGLATAQGPFRISAKAVVEGSIQRAAVAAYDGFIASAAARAGDRVAAGQELAKLDDHELKLEALRWRSEYQQQVLKYNEALGKHDRAAVGIAQAAVDEAQAQLSLVEDKLARSSVVAPFAGVVVSGDLSQSIGSPIEKGKILFELAPLDGFRVTLDVDERDISFLAAGQHGELVPTGLADLRFPFMVKTVTPVATSSEGHTFFRVEADLQDADARLRPGMEGIGKVTIDNRSLLFVWTRSLIDWARITLWKLWP